MKWLINVNGQVGTTRWPMEAVASLFYKLSKELNRLEDLEGHSEVSYPKRITLWDGAYSYLECDIQEASLQDE